MLADKARSAKGAAGGGGSSTYYLAVVSNNNTLKVYPWTSATGYGTAYGAAPGIGAFFQQVAFSPSGNAIFVDGSASNVGAQAWPWSAAGFGTKYADAVIINADISVIGVSPAGDAILCGRNVGPPYTYAYRWTTASGFGTQYSGPGSPSGAVRGLISFAPNAGAVAIGTSINPNIDAYPWSSASGFGSKFANPATVLPSSGGTAFTYVKFSPTGGSIVYGGNYASSTPFVMGYPWSNSTGFGTKYTDPAVLPPGNPSDITFSPAGDVVVFSHIVSPYISAYAWSDATGFGTKFANPATTSPGRIDRLAFAPTGTEIAVGRGGSGGANAFYRWSGAGFGAYVTDGGTAPTGAVTGIAFGTITT